MAMSSSIAGGALAPADDISFSTIARSSTSSMAAPFCFIPELAEG